MLCELCQLPTFWAIKYAKDLGERRLLVVVVLRLMTLALKLATIVLKNGIVPVQHKNGALCLSKFSAEFMNTAHKREMSLVLALFASYAGTLE